MKRDHIIYWICTGIIALLMFTSACNFAFNEASKEAFRHLGLPGWFKIELTVAKFLGAVAFVLPQVNRTIKEFTYFGFALTIVSADIAHLSSGDPVWYLIPHVTFLGILYASYFYYHKIQAKEMQANKADKLATYAPVQK